MDKRLSRLKDITIIALFIALLFISGNIIPPITLMGGIPLTFQILVILLAGSLLGLKRGIIFMIAVYLMTAIGLPMMSKFSGGISALAGPTSGFIWGWMFIIIIISIYKAYFEKLFGKYKFVGYILFSVVGVVIDYLCGAIVVSAYSCSDIFSIFISMFIYLPADLIKAVFAAILDSRLSKVIRF